MQNFYWTLMPLTGEGERSSDEGDIKIYPKRCACYGLLNLFKHNGRLKSTLRGFQTWRLNTSEKGGCKSQQFQAWHNNSNVKERCKSLCFQTWHLNSNMKGGGKSLCFQIWHLNTSVKERCKICLA